MATTRAPFTSGDRLRLVVMVDDPDPIPPGATGTVVSAVCHPGHSGHNGAWWQIGVAWDNGRRLSLTIPPDVAEKI